MRFVFIALLIALNIVAFFLPVFGYDTDQYVFSRQALLSGNYLVLITHMFLHVNLFHLIVNMVALLAFGIPIAQNEGPHILLAIYFLTGISAALLFALVNHAAAVGASGAVFGLLAFVALTHPLEFSFFPFVLPLPMALIAVLYTLTTLLLLSDQSMVGHWAHLGGIISGTLLAFLFKPAEAKHGLIVVAIMAALVFTIPFFL